MTQVLKQTARWGALLAGVSLLAACGNTKPDMTKGPQTTEPNPAGQTVDAPAPAEQKPPTSGYSLQPKSKIGPEAVGLIPQPGPGHLTPEIVNSRSLFGTSLRRAAISPDGKTVTVLRANADGQQDLWAYDFSTGDATPLVRTSDILGQPEVLSEEEKNRRERAREYGSGIISYRWIDEKTLMFPLGGDVFLYDLETKTPSRVTETEGFETDPKVSSSGRYVSYVRGNELFLNDLKAGKEIQISKGATDTIRNATASFVVQEELGRNTGYWLSPTEDYVAYTEIDESPIAIENRLDFGADGVTNIAQRYPFAGTDNATVMLRLAPVGRAGKARVLNISDDPDIYLARVYWSRDGKTLYAAVLTRDNKTLNFMSFDPKTGEKTDLFSETSDTWINVRPQFTPLDDGGFLWMSERSGFRQIYRYSADGKEAAVVSSGPPVSRINCVNRKDGMIFYTAATGSALERHLHRVSMDGGPSITITKEEGRHSASFSKNCDSYIGNFTAPNQPTRTGVYVGNGEGPEIKPGRELLMLNANTLDADHPYAPYLDSHITPEFGQIEAEDGTPLDYVLYKPEGLKAGERRPAIVMVYGGPGVQRVSKAFDGGLVMAQMLADHGFVVFQVDNRGAANRGKAFEDHIYRAMGQVEVTDQLTGVNWLKGRNFVDGERVGIYGWSYGGYMSLHMLAQTDAFRSGVSGAPVTDWTLYDTAYTERYLGDPNPGTPNYTEGAYENGSVFKYLDGLTEPVLLIHGMADDNVVFRHAIKLMDAMQRKGMQNLRVMTYPGEKHGFRAPANRTHRDRQILDFFLETLGD